MKYPASFLLILWLALPIAAMEWQFNNKDSNWQKYRNLTATLTTTGLKLEITGSFSNIELAETSFAPGNTEYLAVTYCAEGFPEITHGQLFFATANHPKFNEQAKLTIGSLISNKLQHTLFIALNQGSAGKLWHNAEKIIALRLDLVNQFPGTVIISSIKLLDAEEYRELQADRISTWDFTRPQPSWDKTRNLSTESVPEGLLLTVSGSDSNIGNDNTALDPTIYNGVSITYCASGFSQKTNGEFFFCNEKEAAFDDRKKIPIPSLISDGNWHTMKLSFNQVQGGKRLWYEGGKVTRLRLDLVNQFPGIITLQHLSLIEYSLSKARMSGIPEKITVTLGKTPIPRTFLKADPHAPAFQSPMVAPENGFYRAGSHFLRTEFTLAEIPEKALLQSLCDDVIEAIYINAQPLDYAWSTDWMTPDTLSIPTTLFRPGKNVLALRYLNRGNIGGVMFDLQLVSPEGEFQVITPAQAQACSEPPEEHWNEPDFTASWPPVATRSGPPTEPWWKLIPPYQTIRPVRGTIEINVQNIEADQATVTFHGTPALTMDEKLYARIYNRHKQLLAFRSGSARELKAEQNATGDLTVVFEHFDLPHFGGELEGTWEFGIYGRNNLHSLFPDFRMPACPLPGKTSVMTMQRTPDGVQPLLNGKPFFLNVLTINNINIPTGMEGPHSPFNVVVFRAGGQTAEWWTGSDQYNFSVIDRQLNILLNRYPDSWLGLYIWCQPGLWYEKQYPERISRQDNGGIMRYYVATTTFSNPDYRQDAQQAVAALIRHCEKYFGSRIVLYNLMGGISCEWQGWNTHTSRFADYSTAGRLDFRNYAQSLGEFDMEVPSPQQRLEADEEGSFFRHPQRNHKAILYDQFYSKSIADCIAGIASAAKQACQRKKLIGAYYGYHQEYSNLGYAVNSSGHNALSVLLNSPDLDFFLSPNSYGVRTLGAPNADMKPFAAIREAGKLSVLEDDTRTHLTPSTGFYQTLNLQHTLEVLKRNHGMALSRKTFLNHLPLTGGNDLDSPEIRALFVRTVKAGQIVLEKNHPSDAEIAVVIDEDSFRYLRPTREKVDVPDRDRFHYSASGELLSPTRKVQPLTGDLLYYQRIPLAQIGAPVDWILLDDVAKQADKYKLVIFLNAFADTPELRNAFAALRQQQTTILVVYGAGFIGKNGLSTKAMSDLLGMQIDIHSEGPLQLQIDAARKIGNEYPVKPRFCVSDRQAKLLGTYTDTNAAAIAEKKHTIFYGGAVLDATFVRQIARQSGVHIYSDTGDNLFVGSGIVCIHASSKGNKIIRLKNRSDAIEIYSGQVAGMQSDHLDFSMEAFETEVFLLGNAKEILTLLGK
ncbi:MAG: hypothetical protein WCT05_12505 [Lentisphaeria bacterium]